MKTRTASTVALAIITTPNLSFIVLGTIIFTSRAWINIDYILAGIAVIFMGRKAILWALPPLLILDAIFSISPAWNFSPLAAISSIPDIFHLPPAYVVPLILAAFFVVFLVSVLIFTKTPRSIGDAPLSSKLFVLAWLVGVGGAIVLADNHFEPSKHTSKNINLAWSGLHSLHVAIKTSNRHEESHTTANSQQPTAKKSALRQVLLSTKETRNIVLVVVESLGLPNDNALNEFQLSSLFDLKSRRPDTTIRYSTSEFSGSTVPAEIRELCGRISASTHPNVSAFSEDCLPRKMKEAGYYTEAIHGFSPAMFSRNLWYPDLGFDQILFAPDLMKKGKMRRCGFAFPGICDEDAWKYVSQSLEKSKDTRRFIYWLTISAHLPLPKNVDWLPEGQSPCPTVDDDGVCALLLVHRHLFQLVADSIVRGELDDTLLIIVGDHAPPFLMHDQRQMFDDSHVPFLEIHIPKRGVESSGQASAQP